MKKIKTGNVYGFTGKNNAGKRSICNYRAEFHNAVHMRFGQQLIAVTKLLYSLEDSHFNEENRTKIISNELCRTPEALMERTKLAIEAYEADDQFMFGLALNRIESFVNKGYNVWISNVCCNEQASALKTRFNATIVQIRRKIFPDNGYQGVDKKYIDLEIDNDGTLQDHYKMSNHVVDFRLTGERKLLTLRKNMVLNNAREHLGDIARELLNIEILDSTKMSKCYTTNEDGEKEYCEYKMDSNSKLDLIFKECYRQISELITEETGVE